MPRLSSESQSGRARPPEIFSRRCTDLRVKLLLRVWKRHDPPGGAARCGSHRRDLRSERHRWRGFVEVEPPDAVEFGRRIADTTVKYPWLVCERGGEVVGYVYASAHLARAAYQWSANVTVYIDSRQRRSGLGRALYTSLFALLKLQGFYNAYGGITLPNAGSVGLHEAMGFQRIGVYREVGYKFGAWHDVGWWGLKLQPKPDTSLHPPLEAAVVQADPAWHTALEAGLPLLRF